MEINGLVDYELLYELELLHPVNDQPIGVTMQIRSAGSDVAKRVLREHTNKNLERRIKGKMPKSEQLEREELEKAASYIVSWDWGTNTYKGDVPKLTMKTAIEILDAEGWIFQQVSEAANKIANFTPPSAPPSVPKSSTT